MLHWLVHSLLCGVHYRIPQLLTCLARNEGAYLLNLLSSIGKAYPQAVYFPIRTLYLSLKLEQKGVWRWRNEFIDNQYHVISVKAEQAKQVTATGDGMEPMQVDPTHQSTTTPESTSIDPQQVSIDLHLCVLMQRGCV